ncbi:hypothetical protein ACJJTC_003505 [Scirpophaga incertulas]
MGYIDLGSKCTLIRRSYAENIIAPEDWETDSLPILQGFGNSVVKPLGRIRTIIQIGMVRAETELLVVDDGYLHTPVLVGQSFTEKPNVILYKTKDELLFISMPDCEDQNIRVKGIIGYSPGHFVAFCRRSNNQWELHNDLSTKEVRITHDPTITPTAAIFIRRDSAVRNQPIKRKRTEE